MTEDDDRIGARHRRIAGLQHSPERRRHAEHREIVAGDVTDGDALGAVVGAEADEVHVVGREILERAALVPEVLVVEPGDVVRILVPFVLDGEHVQAGRVAHRQRFQQQPVDDREHRRIRANPEAQREHDGRW